MSNRNDLGAFTRNQERRLAWDKLKELHGNIGFSVFAITLYIVLVFFIVRGTFNPYGGEIFFVLTAFILALLFAGLYRVYDLIIEAKWEVYGSWARYCAALVDAVDSEKIVAQLENYTGKEREFLENWVNKINENMRTVNDLERGGGKQNMESIAWLESDFDSSGTKSSSTVIRGAVTTNIDNSLAMALSILDTNSNDVRLAREQFASDVAQYNKILDLFSISSLNRTLFKFPKYNELKAIHNESTHLNQTTTTDKTFSRTQAVNNNIPRSRSSDSSDATEASDTTRQSIPRVTQKPFRRRSNS